MDSIHKQDDGQDEKDFLFAMQLATGSMLSMAMLVVVELNVFDIIAKAGPGAQLSPADIMSQLSTENPNAPAILDRVLRLLASHSVLTATTVEDPDGVVQRLYGLDSVCKYFVTNEDGVSLSEFLLLALGKVNTTSGFHLKDAILEGGVAFDKAHGMDMYQKTEVDPPYGQVFKQAMLSHTTIVTGKLMETYKGFDDLKSIVDVGGSIGTTLNIITSKHPSVKATNFDLPHVIARAPSYPGVEHVGGDMFESVPDGEAIFMKWILHNWDDQHCVQVLKNCYKALPKDGKVIVLEVIVPAAVETDNAAKDVFQMDVVMLIQTQGGGKQRTEKEFDTLAIESGFSCARKICRVYNYWVIELYKN